MAEYLIDKAYLVALADAIRKKSGSSSKMTPSAMVSAINNLGDMTYTPQSSSTVINKTGELHTIQDTTFNSLANAIRNKAGISDKMTPHKMIDVVNGLNSAQAFAVFSADDNSLNFYKRVDVPKVGEQFEGKTVTEVYTGIESDFISSSRQLRAPDVSATSTFNTETITVTVMDKIYPINLAGWFNGFSKCKEFNLRLLDTSNVLSMYDMFHDCSSVASLDLSTFETSKCHDFKQMFLSCSNLTDLDVSSFDTTAADNDLAAMFGVLGSSSSALFICNNLKRIVVGDRFTAFKELPAPNGNYIPGADGKWYAVSDGKGYTPENIPSNKADTYVASKDLLPKVIVSNPVNAYTDLYHSPQF